MPKLVKIRSRVRRNRKEYRRFDYSVQGNEKKESRTICKTTIKYNRD